MKIRVIEKTIGTYTIQRKSGFFRAWEDDWWFTSLKDACIFAAELSLNIGCDFTVLTMRGKK